LLALRPEELLATYFVNMVSRMLAVWPEKRFVVVVSRLIINY
jgi:hypothetical protein